MTTPPAPSLAETIPDLTEEEKAEILRLEAQSQTELAQIQALLDDPVIAQSAKMKKTLTKKEKELEQLRDQHSKTIGEITLLTNRKKTPEPTEKGFYIVTNRRFGWGKNAKERTEKSLYLFALGVWWNLSSDGESTVKDDRFGEDAMTFHDLLDMDEHTIEVTIEKLTDESVYPYLALATGAPQLDFADEDETDQVETIGEPQGTATS